MNGREKLLEATRSYLRSPRKFNLTRTEIAEGCGVTPALISYYFKDKNSLLDSVAKPLIRTYARQLSLVLRDTLPASDRLRGAIRLFIQIHMENSFVVDYLIKEMISNSLSADERESLETLYRSLLDVLTTVMNEGLWRRSDPALACLAVWGTCQAFGDLAQLSEPTHDAASVTMPELDARADHVFELFSTKQGVANLQAALASA